ncbi:DUF2510 domain-containing protein [Microbacterium sp. NPDC058342]|uniref:DUF2510 domain-containing protein n=1 Tax=Microbacterium sp. NPDC058342 TaxID=3346454 RepID=UPI003647B44A
MSTPAGWYDDGSGRQRWWDGEQWTERYADGDATAAGSAPSAPDAMTGAPAGADAPAYAAPGYAPAVAPAGPKAAPTLGFVGLGLAVLGTILACIPTVVTFPIGLVLLLAAFVVSMIAVFKKNTAKWPSIVGIILSVVGGVIGAIVFTVVFVVSVATAVGQSLPTDFPTSITSEQPSDEPTDGESEGRPSPEAIGEGAKQLLHDGGITQYDDLPEFYPCVGQYFYDSDLSDEALQEAARGADVTGSERELAIATAQEAILACAPQQ